MYTDLITAATGCTNPADLAEIEDYMRHTIFHSTLDWQTAAQLRKAAKTAWGDIQWTRTPEGLAYITQLEAEILGHY